MRSCGWIIASIYGSQLLPTQIASLLRREYAMLTQNELTGAAFGVAVLDEIGLRARRLHANAETAQFPIPNKDIAFDSGLDRVDTPFCGLFHKNLLFLNA